MESYVINWDAVAAIGQCLGAFATFVAVWVALYQIRRTTTGCIKILVNHGFGIYNNGILGEPFYSFSAINNGAVPITITSCGINIPSKKLDCQFLDITEIKLEPSASIMKCLVFTEINHTLNNLHLYGRVKLRVYFRDTTGRTHYKKFQFKVS